MIKEILCFHTCNNEGGKEFILERAPFHSDTTKPQWLGQGYYLWTDSDYYAHDWGRQAPRYGNYVITKFKLTVESSYFLDLVGNVPDQLYFLGLVQSYRSSLTEKMSQIHDPKKKERFRQALKRPLSVSTVIQHYRRERKFPFKVVKAQDIVTKSTNTMSYVVPSKDDAVLHYPTRQQIVVFPEAKDLLGKAEWHHSESNEIADEV